jgi:hypothetical protein
MTNNPNIIVLALGVLVGISAVLGAVLIVDAGFSTTTALAVGCGIVVGVGSGLLLKLRNPGSTGNPGSLVGMGIAGLGISSVIRFGPPWLAVGSVFAAGAFLLTVGLRRLRAVRTAGPRR